VEAEDGAGNSRAPNAGEPAFGGATLGRGGGRSGCHMKCAEISQGGCMIAGSPGCPGTNIPGLHRRAGSPKQCVAAGHTKVPVATPEPTSNTRARTILQKAGQARKLVSWGVRSVPVAGPITGESIGSLCPYVVYLGVEPRELRVGSRRKAIDRPCSKQLLYPAKKAGRRHVIVSFVKA